MLSHWIVEIRYVRWLDNLRDQLWCNAKRSPPRIDYEMRARGERVSPTASFMAFIDQKFRLFNFQMSHLYTMFAKQVQSYCKSNVNVLTVAQCKRNLLMYGITKLQDMSESHLDVMDPYQRNANDISKC